MNPISLYISSATGEVRRTLTQPPAPLIRAILGTLLQIETTFVDGDNAAVELASGTTGRLVCKAPNALNGDAIILLDAAWSHTTETEIYTFAPLANSEQLLAIIKSTAEITLSAQIEWQLPDEDNPRKSLPFDLLVINSPAREDDGAPDAVADASWVWIKNKIQAGANLTRAVNENTKVITFSGEDADANAAAIDQTARDAAAAAQSTADGKLDPDGDGSQLTNVVGVDQTARDAAAAAQSTADGKLDSDGDGSQLTGVVGVDQTARDAAGACLPLAGGTMNDGAIVAFVNGSKLKVGTTNAGTGGNGGIAQVCSVDYEKKWEAGATYIMQQDGFTIRTLRDALGEPGSTHDTTKGFVVGTRWIQDNGDAWICRDATEDAAVWEAVCDCEIGVALSDETTDLATGSDVVKFSMPYAMYVRDLFLCCSTAPTGAAIAVEAKVGGSAFAGGEIPIDAFDSIGNSGLDSGLLARGAVISFNVTAVGSTIPGKGLKVWLRGSRR